MAARITPVAATALTTGAARKAPSRIRNSPMNPFNPGSPMLERQMIMKSAANQGSTAAKPPNSEISRVWRRS